MKIVIDIPKDDYNAYNVVPDYLCDADMLRIKSGTPLPKNCRLIDANALPNEVQSLYSIRSASTIIGTDGGAME